MLHTHVAAYLRHSPSPSDVNFTAACNPPPRVAAPRVSAFAVRLHNVITANRLQSTSGQDVSRISDAGQPDSAMVSYIQGRVEGGTWILLVFSLKGTCVEKQMVVGASGERPRLLRI